MKSKRVVIFGVMAVVVLGLVAAVGVWWTDVDDAAIQAELQALRAAGVDPDWSLDVEPSSVDAGPELTGVAWNAQRFTSAVTQLQLGQLSADEVAARFAEVQAEFESMERLAQADVALPIGDFDDPYNLGFDHHRAISNGVRMLAARASFAAIQGDGASALRDLETGFKLARLPLVAQGVGAEIITRSAYRELANAAIDLGESDPAYRQALIDLIASVPPLDRKRALQGVLRYQLKLMDDAMAGDYRQDWMPSPMQSKHDWARAWTQSSVQSPRTIGAAKLIVLRAWSVASPDFEDAAAIDAELLRMTTTASLAERYWIDDVRSSLSIYPVSDEDALLMSAVLSKLGAENVLDQHGQALRNDGADVWSIGPDGIDGTLDDVHPLEVL